jgi:hypothetical protein
LHLRRGAVRGGRFEGLAQGGGWRSRGRKCALEWGILALSCGVGHGRAAARGAKHVFAELGELGSSLKRN